MSRTSEAFFSRPGHQQDMSFQEPSPSFDNQNNNTYVADYADPHQYYATQQYYAAQRFYAAQRYYAAQQFYASQLPYSPQMQLEHAAQLQRSQQLIRDSREAPSLQNLVAVPEQPHAGHAKQMDVMLTSASQPSYVAAPAQNNTSLAQTYHILDLQHQDRTDIPQQPSTSALLSCIDYSRTNQTAALHQQNDSAFVSCSDHSHKDQAAIPQQRNDSALLSCNIQSTNDMGTSQQPSEQTPSAQTPNSTIAAPTFSHAQETRTHAENQPASAELPRAGKIETEISRETGSMWGTQPAVAVDTVTSHQSQSASADMPQDTPLFRFKSALSSHNLQNYLQNVDKEIASCANDRMSKEMAERCEVFAKSQYYVKPKSPNADVQGMIVDVCNGKFMTRIGVKNLIQSSEDLVAYTTELEQRVKKLEAQAMPAPRNLTTDCGARVETQTQNTILEAMHVSREKEQGAAPQQTTQTKTQSVTTQTETLNVSACADSGQTQESREHASTSDQTKRNQCSLCSGACACTTTLWPVTDSDGVPDPRNPPATGRAWPAARLGRAYIQEFVQALEKLTEEFEKNLLHQLVPTQRVLNPDGSTRFSEPEKPTRNILYKKRQLTDSILECAAVALGSVYKRRVDCPQTAAKVMSCVCL
jgi:hypothetical protein